MYKRHIASAALTIGFLILAAGSAKPNSDSSSSKPTPATTTATTAAAATTATAATPPEPARTYEKVTAATLMADYKANEVRADNKWKGHYVAMTGTVGDVKKNAFGGIYVLVGTGAQFELNAVHCQFPRKAADQAANLSKGDKVTFNGKVSGMVLTSVIVDDCEIAGN